MSDILWVMTGQGGPGTVDLLDEANYHFVFNDPPNPTRNRSILGVGCGEQPGHTAVLLKSRLTYITRTYTVRCHGATLAAARINRDIIETIITAARHRNLDPKKADGYPAWLVRQLQDETTPTVWTFLDGFVYDVEEPLIALGLDPLATPIITLRVELDLMPGAVTLDGNGFPLDAVQGAGVQLAATFPQSISTVQADGVTLSPSFPTPTVG